MLDLLNNTLANLIVILLLALPTFFLFQLPKKKRMFEFFGFKQNKKLTIYLSTLIILGKEPSLVIDHHGVARSYAGLALPENEFRTIPIFSSLFNLITSGDNFISTLINRLILKDIDIYYTNAPTSISNEELDGNVICLGSPGYNSVSEYYQAKLFTTLKFNKQNTAIVKETETIASPDHNFDFAILEKSLDTDNNTVVFYAAGFGVVGTATAAEYLATNWHKLSKEFENDGFSLCLKIQKVQLTVGKRPKPEIIYKIRNKR